MRMMKPQMVLRGLTRFMSLIAGFAVVFIMVSIAANVFRRQVLDGRSIAGIIEYNEIVLVALVFLSLANTQRTGDHVSVDLLTRRLPARLTFALRGLGMFVAAAFLSWMAWRSLQVGLSSLASREYRFGLARVPIWPARLLIPLGLSVLVLQILIHAAEDAASFFRGEAPDRDGEPRSAGVGL